MPTRADFVDDLNLTTTTYSRRRSCPPGSPSPSWRVRNVGTCPWEADYSLVYVNGNRGSKHGERRTVGRIVQPGETIDLSSR